MDSTNRPQDATTTTNTAGCGTPEPTIHWGNSKGIKAPSETAEPLMATEGYVQDGSSDKESVVSKTTEDAPQPMKHSDEGARVAPTQRNWPL